MSRRLPPRYDLPKAAPQPLRLVQQFLNTTDGHVREILPEWLDEHGVGRSPASLARARAVREALRELLIANNEGGKPRAAIEVLEDAAARARFTARLDPSPELVPLARGLDGALGRLLAIVFGAIEDGTWARLKACRNCHWAFWDESRNRSAAWCSMQLCGNRSKIRTYRRRRRALSG